MLESIEPRKARHETNSSITNGLENVEFIEFIGLEFGKLPERSKMSKCTELEMIENVEAIDNEMLESIG